MLETIAMKFLQWVSVTFPVVGVIVMILGMLFIMLELFVKATPSKKDDKWWASIKSGYMGPFISLLMKLAKNKFKKV